MAEGQKTFEHLTFFVHATVYNKNNFLNDLILIMSRDYILQRV